MSKKRVRVPPADNGGKLLAAPFPAWPGTPLFNPQDTPAYAEMPSETTASGRADPTPTTGIEPMRPRVVRGGFATLPHGCIFLLFRGKKLRRMVGWERGLVRMDGRMAVRGMCRLGQAMQGFFQTGLGVKRPGRASVRCMGTKRRLFPVEEQRNSLQMFDRERTVVHLARYGSPVSYCTAWDWQRELVGERVKGSRDEDMLLVLQHPPVYTLGRGSSPEHVRFEPDESGFELHRTERGGEVTFHGPGQVVGYPIIDLRRYHKDLHWYLFQLEEVVIRSLGDFGIDGSRDSEHTGVWVGQDKIAAVGINVTRWWTMHGFAVNVDTDLSWFDRIVPCGIEGRGVCRLADLCPAVRVADVEASLMRHFEDLFNCELHEADRGGVS